MESSFDQHQGRRRFSDSDIEALVKAIKTAQGEHECRFDGIAPDDLKAMVDAHRSFNAALSDSKAIVRRFFIVLVLTGVSGYAVYGWWGKLIDTVKKSISGGQ